ncbi:hypothetical protein AB0B83_11890 [Micromonospora sp. NPDC049060]
MAVHHEQTFGDAIVAALLANGWERGGNDEKQGSKSEQLARAPSPGQN